MHALRGGASAEAAAKSARAPLQELRLAARTDSELQAALDGQALAVQLAARKGDFLACLTRTAGDLGVAARKLGLSDEEVLAWRAQDPGYAAAEDAVLRWIAAIRPPRLDRTEVTEAMLDQAAELLEGGTNLTGAAKAIGTSTRTLRERAKGHPRLAAVLPPPRRGGLGGNRPSGLTPEVTERLRQLWADPQLNGSSIAMRLGVDPQTARRWAASLGLPPKPRGRTARGLRPGPAARTIGRQ